MAPNPVTTALNPLGAISGDIGGAVVGKAASTVTDDMLKPLFQSNLWLRVGEVLCGLILLGIGVNALFKGAPMGTVTKTAGKLAPLAMA